LVVVLVNNFSNSYEGEEVVIDVTTQQFQFTPNEITVNKGDHVLLRITSLDVTHGIQLEEFNIYNVETPAGETTEVSFVANKVGTFYFYCTVFCGTGHPNHLGTLKVVEP
jgi:cytochrome c oxidase subunit 2